MTLSKEGKFVIALDVMGGDHAPHAMLAGAERFLESHGNVNFLLYGSKQKIEPLLKGYKHLSKHATVHHTDVHIASDERPSLAIRQKDSSMRLALNAVKAGEAHSMVSAGNTGALMATAKLVLRTLPGVHRPAIATLLPTRKNPVVMLDLGANIECDSENLIQFALMGDAFAKVLLNLDAPRVAILNVGSEDMKGHDTLKLAARVLKSDENPINFRGFVEGDSVTEGNVDVVVTDGFTGNVALKTAEGTARLCSDYIKAALKSTPLAALGGVLARAALKKTFKKLDPRLYNGAMMLGLGGICVKSHGGSDEVGNANAIRVAYELAFKQINERIEEEFSMHESLALLDEMDEINL